MSVHLRLSRLWGYAVLSTIAFAACHGDDPSSGSADPAGTVSRVCAPASIGGPASVPSAPERGVDKTDDDDDDDDDTSRIQPDARCRSGWRWTGRDHESSLMHPGADCIACHRSRTEEAPSFSVAGTIYAAAGEPTDCLGVDLAIIRLTDAGGQQIELSSNRAGNFYLKSRKTRIALPYTAEVLYQGRSHRMATPQCETSCNSCHTATGQSGAPGRIVVR